MVPKTGPEIIPLEPDPGNAGVGKRTRWVLAERSRASRINRFRKTGNGFVFKRPRERIVAMARSCGASTRKQFVAALLLASLTSTPAWALSGHVIDAQTLKPVAAATVRVTGTTITVAADDSGRFILERLPEGVFEISVSHVAYHPWRRLITKPADLVSVRLEPLILQGQEIVVTGTRAKRGETPAAFDDLSQEEIRRSHYAQDVPMLLTESPGVYAYSDNGNGIGYSYLSIRGFSQRRVSVLINGVPLNDPESHEVYWIDIPDLPENTQDIQIQRGVGTTLYGANSIGGTINVLTHYMAPVREVSFSSGIGSYDTRKFSVGFNSGLIDARHSVYGRFSRIVSDGYRDNAWTDLWSYFLSAARYDEKWTNRLNIFGGPEQTHLAYKGIPRWFINGDTTFYDTTSSNTGTLPRPTGNTDKDRKFNPFEWEGETDNFNQPHYQWLTEYRHDSLWRFENTAYYIKGEGYYDQLRTGADFGQYYLTPFTFPGTEEEIDEADQLWRRRWVENDFWGLIPRVTRRHNRGEFALGVEFNRLVADHWAEVQSVSPAPPDFTPGQRYYDYDGRKTVVTPFVQEVYTIDPRLTLTGALSYSFKRYELANNAFANGSGQRVEHQTDYNFISPRFGATYRPTRATSLFGSISYNEQEPTNDEIFDATDYFANAGAFFGDTVRNDAGVLIGSDPIIKPERLLNYEIGASIQQSRWRAEVNLYHMRFHDEIVWNGLVSDDGVPIRANAPSSIHQGVEVSIGINFAEGLTLDGNASLSDNYLDEFLEYVPDWANWDTILPIDTVDRAGNTIAGFPEQLANLRLTYDHKFASVSAHVFHAGELFIDNSNEDDKRIAPRTALNLRGSVKLDEAIGWAGVDLYIQINNVFDKEYETGGYVDEEGPLFIPAAKRNFFAGLRARL